MEEGERGVNEPQVDRTYRPISGNAVLYSHDCVFRETVFLLKPKGANSYCWSILHYAKFNEPCAQLMREFKLISIRNGSLDYLVKRNKRFS